MKALPFTITLHEPVLVARLGGDPNSAVSHPYIPGSTIRGAIAARYLKGSSIGDLAADKVGRRLLLDGTTRFLNGYPLDSAGERTLPVPLSLVKEKRSEPPTWAYDLSTDDGEAGLDEPKPLGASFCRLTGNCIELYSPLFHFSVHTQRDRQMGRATEQSGAIFRYEALESAQQFGAIILLDVPEDLQLIGPLLSGDMLLGGSRSAGYGRVSVDVGEPSDTWLEAGGAPREIPAQQSFRITLLSDAIVRDGHGQWTTALSEKDVGSWLGVERVKVREVFTSSGVAGGFNRKWGMPLPQVPNVRAGSVFVLQCDEPIRLDATGSLLTRGVGDRRTEGYGRVALDWHTEKRLRVQKGKPFDSRQPNLAAVTSDDGAALAKRMAARLLERDIDAKLTKYVNDLRFEARGISSSQLARLRVLVRNAQRGSEVERVANWLKELRPVARRQFETARVRGVSLLVWLNEQLQQPAGAWTTIRLSADALPAFGSERIGLSDEWHAGLALRLVDAVLARAAKEIGGNE